MVWQPPKSKIGFPLGGTWIVPGATASEIRSTLSTRSSFGPSRRTPKRSESAETENASLVRRRRLTALKRFQSTQGMKRNTGSRFASLGQSSRTDHVKINVTRHGAGGLV